MDAYTEIDITNSFMQTIVKLPADKFSLLSMDIPLQVIAFLDNFNDYGLKLIDKFKVSSKFGQYIKNGLDKKDVFYVKTFPDEEYYNVDDVRHYLCFGKYNIKGLENINCIFFRIDQDFSNFLYPQIDSIQFKEMIPYLSGTKLSRPDLPSVILDITDLNDKELLILNQEQVAKFDGLYFIGLDYFNKATFIDVNGFIWEYSLGNLTQTNMDFENWYKIEINK